MTDLRTLVAGGLLSIIDNVKMSRPAGDVSLPLICYAETSNTSVNIAMDRVRYRVAVYASTFDELVTLVNQVDEVMAHHLGFQRVATNSDAEAMVATDLYLKRIDYQCSINKADGGYIIRNAK